MSLTFSVRRYLWGIGATLILLGVLILLPGQYVATRIAPGPFEITSPAVYEPGKPVLITWNASRENAAAYREKIMFCPDRVFLERCITVAPDTANDGAEEVIAPATATSGTWYVYMIARDQKTGQLISSRFSMHPVRPSTGSDLPFHITGPDVIEAGQPVTFTWRPTSVASQQAVTEKIQLCPDPILLFRCITVASSTENDGLHTIAKAPAQVVKGRWYVYFTAREKATGRLVSSRFSMHPVEAEPGSGSTVAQNDTGGGGEGSGGGGGSGGGSDSGDDDQSDEPPSAEADTTAPEAPTDLAASTIDGLSIALAWQPATDNVGVVAYHVFRGSVHVATVTEPTYQDAGLNVNTSYQYTVRALDAAGNRSTESNVLDVRTLAAHSTPDTEPPTAPAGVVAEVVGPTNVQVSWSASTDNVEVGLYRVYRDNVFVRVTPAQGAQDTTAVPGASHQYHVVAFDSSGNPSPASETVEVTMPALEVPSPTPVSSLVPPASPPPVTDPGLIFTTTDGQTVPAAAPLPVDVEVQGITDADPLVCVDWELDGLPLDPSIWQSGQNPLAGLPSCADLTIAPTVSAPLIHSRENAVSGTMVTVTLRGTAEAGNTIHVVLDGAPQGAVPVSGTFNQWTHTLQLPNNNTNHDVSIWAKDAAGNVSRFAATQRIVWQNCRANSDPLNQTNGSTVRLIDQQNCTCADPPLLTRLDTAAGQPYLGLSPTRPRCSIDSLNETSTQFWRMRAGDTVFVREGEYTFNPGLGLVSSGTAAARIAIKPYPTSGGQPEPVTLRSGAEWADWAFTIGSAAKYVTLEGFTVLGHIITPLGKLYAPLVFVSFAENLEMLNMTVRENQGWDDVHFLHRRDRNTGEHFRGGRLFHVGGSNSLVRNVDFQCFESVNLVPTETAQREQFKDSGDGLLANNCNNCIIEKSRFALCPHQAVRLNNSAGLHFRENEVSNPFNTAVSAGVNFTDSELYRNLIHDYGTVPLFGVGGNGIQHQSASRNKIYNNIFHSGGLNSHGVVTGSSAVDLQESTTDDNEIFNNTFHDAGSNPISVLHFSGRPTAQNRTHRNRVYNNLVMGAGENQGPTTKAPLKFGFFNPPDFTVSSHPIVHRHNYFGNRFEYNLLWQTDGDQIIAKENAQPFSMHEFTVATFHALRDATTNATLGIGNIMADPLLRDPADGDFRPLPNSPAVAASNCPGLTVDYAGKPRQALECTIGALEP